MNIFDFENRLKNHAAHSKGKVDMNRLLSDLDIKPQPKSYRRYIYFFVSGILLVGLGYLSYSYSQNDNTHAQQSTAVIEVKDTPADTKTIEKEIINQTPISEETNTNNTTKAINTAKQFEAANNIHKTESAKTRQTKNTNRSTSNLATNKASAAQESKPNTKDIEAQNVIFNSEFNQSILVPITNSSKTEKETEHESRIMASGNRSSSETQIVKKPADIKNSSVALLPSAPLVPLPSFKRFNNKGTTCPQFSDRLWHMYIIPEIGYTFPMKSLSLNDEDFRFVFDERVANETTIEGINAALFLQFKNQYTGLYVKPGVSYSRITERIDFVRSEIDIDTSSVTTIIRDTDGEIISEITEEVITENERVTSSRVHYQLHEFELPVALGYSFSFNRFAIDIEAGIKLNFLQRATGQILYRGAEFNDLSNNGQDLFKNSVGLGFFGGVLFKRQLNRRTELYVAPRFSFNTLSYSSNLNPISQRYNVVGLHAGLIHAIY